MLAATDKFRLSALPGIGILTGVMRLFDADKAGKLCNPRASFPKIATTERSKTIFDNGKSAEVSRATNVQFQFKISSNATFW